MKSERNKTIDLTVEAGREYLERCVSVTERAALSDVLDKTILGDSFSVLPLLPEKCVDLLIVDPPYNLDKTFGESGFARMTDEEYAAYTEKWIALVTPLLKPDATIYVCCDWQSSPVIGMALQRHFTVRNRITWQREKGRGARANWNIPSTSTP